MSSSAELLACNTAKPNGNTLQLGVAEQELDGP
jgi:hypothetical protein